MAQPALLGAPEERSGVKKVRPARRPRILLVKGAGRGGFVIGGALAGEPRSQWPATPDGKAGFNVSMGGDSHPNTQTAR